MPVVVGYFEECLKELKELEQSIGPELLEQLYQQYEQEKELFSAINCITNSLKIDSTAAYINESCRLRKQAEERIPQTAPGQQARMPDGQAHRILPLLPCQE